VKIPKIVKKTYWLLFGVGLFFIFSGLNLIFNPSAEARDEVKSEISLEQSANVLAGKTLSNFGKFTSGGSVQLPSQASSVLGVNKIEWKAGQSPIQAIPMGVWNAAFKVGSLSPSQINPSVDMNKAALSNFGYLKGMPIADLAEGIPSLNNLKINSVAPVASALQKAIIGGAALPTIPSGSFFGGRRPVETIGQLIKAPGWANMPLGELNKFPAISIPGLVDTPIGKFRDIAGLPAIAFPGLPTMPIVDMPGFKVPAGYQVGKLDVVHTKEPTKRKVISGSDQEPNAKCLNKNCNSIEIRGFAKGILDGSQIVDGNTQKVRGGWGFLSGIAGGQESPGLYPYGNSLKEVYKDVNAKAGTVNRAWYFRYCQSGFGFDLGCTPYFIGPIPIGSLNEASQVPLLLGNVTIPIEIPKNKLTTSKANIQNGFESTEFALDQTNKGKDESGDVIVNDDIIVDVDVVVGANKNQEQSSSSVDLAS
jgi:hypothetical protein